MEHSRTSIINYLIEQNNFKSYLEIGIRYPWQNFDLIKCDIKVGVDPVVAHDKVFALKSDEFFKVNKSQFDLIFIDGDHLEEQVMRDADNSLKALSKNGTIVIHDCYPKQEDHQGPKDTVGVWMGTVWKTILKLKATRSDLKLYVCEADCGCGILRRGNQNLISLPSELTWDFYITTYRTLVDMVSFDDLIEMERRK